MNTQAILLIEDNQDDVELTLRALEKNQIANPVIVTHNGHDALDFLFGRGAYADRDAADMPAVVVLDLNLPGLDGFEVLESLRRDRRTRMLPVVILTTSRNQQDILKGYAFGANSYVVKPVSFEQFIDTIKQVGLYWLQLNESPEGDLLHTNSFSLSNGIDNPA